MRYHEIINESRSGLLYHYMQGDKAEVVFRLDEMPAYWEHNIPGVGKVKGNSFTRNPRYNHGRAIRLVVDRDRVAQRNRIIPLDGEYVFRHRYHNEAPVSNFSRDRRMNTGAAREQLAEEFVVGDIKKLHLCVVAVQLDGQNAFLSGAEMIELYEQAQAYCEKWSIALEVSKSYTDRMEQTREYWRLYDEEDDADAA